MAVTANAYGSFIPKALNKEIDADTDAIKAMLLTSSYTFSAAHDYKDDVVANEVAATGGYTAGGATVTAAVAYTAANSWSVSRANSTAYTVGQIVRPATGNTFVYQCITAGTSGGSIPTYPTTLGGTVTDGSVVWLCVGSGVVALTSTAAAWSSSTITARYVVFYNSSPASDATRPLIACVNLGVDVSSTAATWTYTPDSTGVVTIPVA